MKRCSRCKAEKPLDDFHRQSSSKDGHQAECKVCKHERKALKAGDTTKVTRVRNGQVQEYLRGPNHGESKTSLYRRWKSMHQRCENPNSRQYRWYGGKGVRVAEEWSDWPTFRQWAETSGYQNGLELDRVDADGDYGPDNCRWLPKRENIKRARLALPEEAAVLLAADAAMRDVSTETLIAEIVTRHYTAAAEERAPRTSQTPEGSATDGEGVMADVRNR